MIAFKFIAFLALAYSVKGGADLELAKEVVECARAAITEGVPAARIPSHNPLRLAKFVDSVKPTRNLTINNLVWYGIPDFELRTAEQLSEDTDDTAAFEFDLHWMSFNMSFDFALKVLAADGIHTSNASAVLNWTHTDWKGFINFTKPGADGLGSAVKDLEVTWSVYDIAAHVSGLGESDGIASALFSLGLQDYLNNVLGTGMSPMIVDILNNRYFANATRVPTLLDWCKNNQKF